MKHLAPAVSFAGVVIVVLTTGCHQMRNDMSRLDQKADRPPEMARLDCLIGDWTGDAKFQKRSSGKTETSNCACSFRWAADEWVLIEEFERGEGDERVAGVSFWTWDDKKELYQIKSYVDSGAESLGTAVYWKSAEEWVDFLNANSEDDAIKKPIAYWFVNCKTRNPYTDITTEQRGNLAVADDGTMSTNRDVWLTNGVGFFSSSASVGSLECHMRRR